MRHNSNPFKWRHYSPDIILLCVRRYLRYMLSYRDLEEMMQERGLAVDHTTLFRWVRALCSRDQQTHPSSLEVGGCFLPH